MSKVIIAGSRDFHDYKYLKRACDKYIKPNDEIVSGTANGADKLGERYAKEKGLKIHRFPADWDKYKKRAGYLRNEEMAKFAEKLIAFWDGKSKGTEHMINLAKEYGLIVIVIEF